MKKYLLLLALAFFVFVKGASANEGTVDLRGSMRGACFAASIYMDGSYKILMTCRELVTAIQPEKNRYVVWIEDVTGKVKRIGEIVNGKMSTISDVKFVKMFVTIEESDYGNKPSEDVVLSGFVTAIDFGKDIQSTPIITSIVTPTTEITPTPSRDVTATVKVTTPTVTKTTSSTTSQSGLGSALSTIFKIALFGFGLLLVVVGVFSFLQRRRSL